MQKDLSKQEQQVIEEMVEILGIEAVIDYCRCNVYKYATKRDKTEKDIIKAAWHRAKLRELNGVERKIGFV